MNASIRIGKLYSKNMNDGKVRLCSDIIISTSYARTQTMWYEVEESYKNTLSIDRADAFLVAFLPYAMLKQMNVIIETPISRDLLYRIRYLLIPAICEANKKFHEIQIEAQVIDKVNGNDKRGVGIALSGGVDSFYSVMKNLNSNDISVKRITHLTLFNVGAFGEFGGSNARKSFYDRIISLSGLSDQLQLPLVIVDSNISEILRLPFGYSISFRDISAALVLENLLDTYYISGGFKLSEMKVVENDIRKYENWIMNCISNDGMKFIWFGGEASRTQKLEYLSQFDIAVSNLFVCISNMLSNSCNTREQFLHRNCSINCTKCLRTMLELYSINQLDKYRGVFDVDLFMKNIDQYIGFTIYQKDNKVNWFEDIYQQMIKRNYQFSKKAYGYALKYKVEHCKLNTLLKNKFYWIYPFE